MQQEAVLAVRSTEAIVVGITVVLMPQTNVWPRFAVHVAR